MNKRKKLPYYIVLGVLSLLSFWGIYLIFWGGQFSVHNLHSSQNKLQQVKISNQKLSAENLQLAEENNLIVSDETTQRRKCAELGYKQKGEKIIKKLRQY